MAEEKKKREFTNKVYIGDKPFMNYVTSVTMMFTTTKFKEVEIVARGKFISRAVDIALVSRDRFLEGANIEITDINISSEEFESKEGKQVRVSAISIIMKKV